jgi:hypothetical protein
MDPNGTCLPHCLYIHLCDFPTHNAGTTLVLTLSAPNHSRRVLPAALCQPGPVVSTPNPVAFKDTHHCPRYSRVLQRNQRVVNGIVPLFPSCADVPPIPTALLILRWHGSVGSRAHRQHLA